MWRRTDGLDRGEWREPAIRLGPFHGGRDAGPARRSGDPVPDPGSGGGEVMGPPPPPSTTKPWCRTIASTPRSTPSRASSRTRWSGSSGAAGSSSATIARSRVPATSSPGDRRRAGGHGARCGRRGAVLVNRCLHRGTMVCPIERGHARTFACPYHGWTYDLAGCCSASPTPAGTRVRQDRARAARAARVATYRGFVFASFRRRGPSLMSTSACATRLIDRSCDLVPVGRGRAHRRLGQAPLRGQLEDAARERQRRLSPRLRPSRAVRDGAHAVSARGRRREGDQGGRARLGQRPHRDRLVARLSGPVRVARQRLGPRRGRLRGRARAPGRAGARAPTDHGGPGARAHLSQPVPRRDQHRDRRAGERRGVRALAHADVPHRRARVQQSSPPHGRGGHGPGVVPDAGGPDRGRPQPARPPRARRGVAPARRAASTASASTPRAARSPTSPTRRRIARSGATTGR